MWRESKFDTIDKMNDCIYVSFRKDIYLYNKIIYYVDRDLMKSILHQVDDVAIFL